MRLDNVYVVDIECDSLLEHLTKLHILSVGWWNDKGELCLKSTNNEEDIKKLFENPSNTIVGHFFLGYDVRALKKLYPNIDFKAKIIDTLSLSHYLYNERPSHSLDSWGEDLGYSKVKIGDEEWKNLSYEKAKERCERDVVINMLLWKKQLTLLRELYGSDDKIVPVINRANFKIELQAIQDDNKIKLDVDLCRKNLAILEDIVKEKTEEVEKILPKVPKTAIRKRPKKMYKGDGTLSSLGVKWLELLKEMELPESYEGEIEVVTGYSEPNASSTKQMKDFLFSKGWKPKLFKDGANGKVPQLRDDDKNLCSSITKMFDKYPELEALEGLSVAQHRAGYLKSFLETMTEDGYVTASWSGTAKTWRVKHVKPIVNLPANNSQHGELVRSCLIAPKGKVFVNADLSSLEDKTKQVAIYDLDPEYVETLNTPGYDAHLAIGLRVGFFTEEEVEFYKWYKKDSRKIEDCPESFKAYTKEEMSEQFDRLSKKRSSSKTTNYAATYNASAKKIAETADIPLKEAKELHKGYWDLNWSLKKFADSLETKVVDGKKWMYSPYTKLWLYLTSDHLKFSAFNQNFGSCVFDLLLWFLIQEGVNPIMTIHDELSWYIDEGEEEKTREIVDRCIGKVNNAYKYPIKFESEPEFAKSYGEVH